MLSHRERPDRVRSVVRTCGENRRGLNVFGAARARPAVLSGDGPPGPAGPEHGGPRRSRRRVPVTGRAVFTGAAARVPASRAHPAVPILDHARRAPSSRRATVVFASLDGAGRWARPEGRHMEAPESVFIPRLRARLSAPGGLLRLRVLSAWGLEGVRRHPTPRSTFRLRQLRSLSYTRIP